MSEFDTRKSVVFENQGQKIFGMWHQPKKVEGLFPSVLVCHGFGGTKVGTYRVYVSIAERLAERGIGCLRFDYRGAGDSEGDSWEMSINGIVDDVGVALEFMKEQEGVDGEKLGLLGTSLGGLVSVLAASRYQAFKTLALWAPLFSTQRWISHFAPDTDRLDPTELVVDGWPVGLEFVQQFIGARVDKTMESLNHMPLLHIHGEADQQVPIDHADGYEACRKDADVESKFIRLPHGDHSFSHPEDRRLLADTTADWFKKYL